MPFLPTASSGASWHDFVKIPAASSGAFRAGGHYADIARSASTCPSKEAICYVGGICPPNPLTRMPFLPTASSGASWHDFVKSRLILTGGQNGQPGVGDFATMSALEVRGGLPHGSTAKKLGRGQKSEVPTAMGPPGVAAIAEALQKLPSEA